MSAANGSKATTANPAEDKKDWEKAEELLAQAEQAVAGEDTSKPLVLDLDEETSKHVKVRVDKRVLELIDAKDARRQRLEEVRANHRNFNRTLTLVLTILIGVAVVETLPYLGHVGHVLAPFAFCITVSMDLLVTGWAYIRHY